MRTDRFDFDLPAERIAQYPIRPRDAARLLVVGERLVDRRVRDLPQLLRRGDLLVCNDTRVIPARLVGMRGAARVEVTLHQPASADLHDAGTGDTTAWRAFARPARRLRLGDCLHFAHRLSDHALSAEVVAKGGGGEVTLEFDCGPQQLLERLDTVGQMPLPQYIRRPAAGDPQDRADYQTLFARHAGAVAAPTASLHFTPPLMTALAARGIDHTFVTLHVGAGTFLPVKAADTDDHRMHAEWYRVPADTAARIAATRAAGGRIVAVGTTVLRTLETVAAEGGRVVAASGSTQLFITPGFRFRVVDLLLTNFHLPRSTLFMLVAGFSGLERIGRAYAHAIEHGYRFYSYGDACLLEPAGVAPR